MSKAKYTRISINRADLFEVCRYGFIAHRVGSLYCEGYVPTERLSLLTVKYQAL